MIYEPAEDSFLLANEIKNYAKGKKVLDMGSGSGIQAEYALKAGASSVLASDINKESIEHIRKKGIKSKQSNLFSNISGKFDLILFNPPYLPEDSREDKESRKVTTGGKNGDEIICKFLNEAYKHLSKKGEMLLVVSSLTPFNRINRILKKNYSSNKIIASSSHFMESLSILNIKAKGFKKSISSD